ncbi:hypothetical protein GH714_001468 [Hevea brasiliensis]|uniref:Uncharacterized protein n=1 Tax=Hevea brasiliensis TaxID=3981 RepID=A0A6A6L8X2_HEVBR|nr:hypothetical protein GH714_001468 [Hevea brasiliensis]
MTDQIQVSMDASQERTSRCCRKVAYQTCCRLQVLAMPALCPSSVLCSRMLPYPTPFGRVSCQRIFSLLSPAPAIIILYWLLPLPRNNSFSDSAKIQSSSTRAKRVLRWKNGLGRYVICFLQGTSRLSGAILLLIGDGYPNRIPDLQKWLAYHGIWLEISGKINTQMLSPATLYTAYLVFKLATGAFGFQSLPAEVSVGLAGSESFTRGVFLDAKRGRRRRHGMLSRSWHFGLRASVPTGGSDGGYPKERADGWLEIKLGFF